MKVSPVLKDSGQLALFDRDRYTDLRYSDGKINHGRCRGLIGNFFEELTMVWFGGERHKLDSRFDYCPDISIPGEVRQYLEVKAAGNSKQTFVYRGRLLKDCRFTKSRRLMYVVWHHRLATQEYDTAAELLDAMPGLIQCVYRVPFHEMWAIANETPIEKLNSQYGKHGSEKHDKCYGEGHRISIKSLESFRQDVDLTLCE